jgi:hypothetical protein
LEKESDTEVTQPIIAHKEIDTSENVTPVHNTGNGYVEFEGRQFQRDALKELRPDLFRLKADDGYKVNSNFGTQFPRIATKGDLFVRVDVLPNRVFKFDGKKWLEQNKNLTQSYMDRGYIEFLVDKLNNGEYDLDQLSEGEKAELEDYLKGNQNS